MDTLDTVHLPIGPTALSAGGLLGPDSEIIANFTWPGLGRPHFRRRPRAIHRPCCRARSACRGRGRIPPLSDGLSRADRALGQRRPSRIVPALLADPLADGDGWVIPLLASVEERRLYDVAIRGAHNWVTVAPRDLLPERLGRLRDRAHLRPARGPPDRRLRRRPRPRRARAGQ